ncbi:hypothetical protein PVAP13_9NG151000 [Panicum virgatum]|uniref:Uncharacterized protein n=1 Tax=Panicum virgatum TaxID=38727 RepID=A0A8T0MI10_PANVG|nr:hypothetical protein PVAP13_9NG151000 [Panicum virgatum]
MDLVCHGQAGFFPVGGDDDGVKLLFLLLLSVGVGSGEDRRWMDLLQTGVGSGVFGGAGSGAPSVRLGFLFTLCVRWGGLCTPVCLVWAGGGGALFALGACLPRRDSFRRRRIPLSCPVPLPMRTCCWAAAARRWWLQLLFAGVVTASGRCAGDGGGFLVVSGQIQQRRGWHRRLWRRSREVCTPPP